MRFLITLLLAVLAAVLVTAAVTEMTGSDEEKSWLGSRKRPTGSAIASFAQSEVDMIQLSRPSGEEITLRRADIGWQIEGTEGETNDRADALRLSKLVNFTLNSKVLDSFPRNDVEPTDLGLGPQRIEVELSDSQGKRLAKYLIGRKTPIVDIKVEKESRKVTKTPSVYIRHNHQPLKNTVYICSDPTGNIHELFAESFDSLRDPRPFFFLPNALTSIRIKNEQSEILLNRPNLSQPWTIAKPLKLKTDSDAVKSLVQQLFKLKANTLSRTNTTIPVDTASTEIALASFGSTEETILSINTPAENDTTAQATVSDRDSVFTLPLKSSSSSPGLSSLPLSLNELRFKKLTALSPPALQTIKLTGPESDEILITRQTPRQVWHIFEKGSLRPVNDFTLFGLFSALVKDDVAGFTKDAAVDLAPYGLDIPILSITIMSFDGKGLLIKIGRSADGKIHAIRDGQPYVYELSEESFNKIATVRAKWKDLRPWNFNRVDTKGLLIRRKNFKDVSLTYDFISEKWDAFEDKDEATSRLIIPRANKLLETLENLKVTNWIPGNDPTATEALRTPVFQLKILSVIRGTQNKTERTLTIARASNSVRNSFFFCHLSGEPSLFVLDQKTIKKLIDPLLEAKTLPPAQ